jgi:hypothetical protein
MPTRPQIAISKEELERANIPFNHVLIKMLHTSEGIKSKGGVIIGFNTDTVYAEGDNSWSADLAECYGEVYKVPQKLFFAKDDPNSMDWDTDMELMVGDIVWFSILESKNSVQLLCEGVLYKSIPYSDCYVAKRLIIIEHPVHFHDGILGAEPEAVNHVIPLNGYVLLEPVNFDKLSHLDAISDTQIDKSRGIIRFIGNAPKSYLNDSYAHIFDLKVGDEVLFDKKSSPFYLERTKSLSIFDGNNQYWVVPRRKISVIIKSEKL